MRMEGSALDTPDIIRITDLIRSINKHNVCCWLISCWSDQSRSEQVGTGECIMDAGTTTTTISMQHQPLLSNKKKPTIILNFFLPPSSSLHHCVWQFLAPAALQCVGVLASRSHHSLMQCVGFLASSSHHSLKTNNPTNSRQQASAAHPQMKFQPHICIQGSQKILFHGMLSATCSHNSRKLNPWKEESILIPSTNK